MYPVVLFNNIISVMSPLLCSKAWQLSQNVPEDAGFLHNKAVMSVDILHYEYRASN